MGAGEISKKVTVAAFRTSGQAKRKVAGAGGLNMSLEELIEKNPKGANVRLMG